MAPNRSGSMQLRSSGFSHDGAIPSRFTCDGDDLPPPLAWSGAPAGTRSFALVCHDPDAPSGDWYHWAVFDISAGDHELAEGDGPRNRPQREAVNDFGKRGWGGPCPPRGHGHHHYHFKIYALDVERLDLPANTRCRNVERAAAGHALASAELVGIYSR